MRHHSRSQLPAPRGAVPAAAALSGRGTVRPAASARDAHDLTLRGFADQLSEAVINIDARLIGSFRCLVTRPGALTVAPLAGQRKPYRLPLPLFLVANLAFFAV
jgi:hypothetical protein